MNDFSSPRRMNVRALIILMRKSLKEMAGIVFLVIVYPLFKNHDSTSWSFKRGIFAVGLIAVFSIFMAFIKYYFRKFHVEGDRLIFTHGLAYKKTTSIPLAKVHTLRTKSGMFYRILGLRGVTFDTLASDKEEVELILDEKEWQTLLGLVRNGENPDRKADNAVSLPPPFQKNHKAFRVKDVDILKSALCQNVFKGFAILATVVIAVYDKISMFGEDAATLVFGYIDTHAGNVLQSVGECVLFVGVIYLVVMMLWIGKIFLRYSNLNLSISDSRLTMESGMLARFTCRIDRRKATVFAIKQNPLEKLTRSQTIYIRQAMNVSSVEKEGNIRIYGSNLGTRLLKWWLGDSKKESPAPILSAKSGKGLFVRRFIPHLILALAAVAIAARREWLVLPAIVLGTVYVAATALRAVMAWKHSGIVLTENYVRINCGNIAIVREYIKYCDIESAAIVASPFTALTGRVCLRISTNAQAFSVYSLRIRSAYAIRNILLSNTL